MAIQEEGFVKSLVRGLVRGGGIYARARMAADKESDARRKEMREFAVEKAKQAMQGDIAAANEYIEILKKKIAEARSAKNPAALDQTQEQGGQAEVKPSAPQSQTTQPDLKGMPELTQAHEGRLEALDQARQKELEQVEIDPTAQQESLQRYETWRTQQDDQALNRGQQLLNSIKPEDLTDQEWRALQNIRTDPQFRESLTSMGHIQTGYSTGIQGFIDAAQGKIAGQTKNEFGFSAADMAMINGLQRIGNPRVAVREGDVQTMLSTPGIDEQLAAFLQKVGSQSQFTPELRNELAQLIINRYNENIQQTYVQLVDDAQDWIDLTQLSGKITVPELIGRYRTQVLSPEHILRQGHGRIPEPILLDTHVVSAKRPRPAATESPSSSQAGDAATTQTAPEVQRLTDATQQSETRQSETPSSPTAAQMAMGQEFMERHNLNTEYAIHKAAVLEIVDDLAKGNIPDDQVPSIVTAFLRNVLGYKKQIVIDDAVAGIRRNLSERRGSDNVETPLTLDQVINDFMTRHKLKPNYAVPKAAVAEIVEDLIEEKVRDKQVSSVVEKYLRDHLRYTDERVIKQTVAETKRVLKEKREAIKERDRKSTLHQATLIGTM